MGHILRHIYLIWGAAARSLSLLLESGIKWTQGGSYNANPCFFVIFFNIIIIVIIVMSSLHTYIYATSYFSDVALFCSRMYAILCE